MSSNYHLPAALAFRRKLSRPRLLKRLLRSLFGFAGRVAPSLAAARAEALFRTPPKCPPTRFEKSVLARGDFRFMSGPSGRLAAWHWGEGPLVLLLHGWGGHAGRLAHFVAPLTGAGFSVLAFDAPGHGQSEGRLCSLPDVALAARAVIDATQPVAVIAHSMGATAAALAARDGARFGTAVFLAPAATPEDYPGRFGRCLGMPAESCASMKQMLANRYHLSWTDISLASFASKMTARLLVFHDPRDGKVPFREGRAIGASWPGAQLVPVRGVGHHRILKDASVIAAAVAFLSSKRAFEIPQARAS